MIARRGLSLPVFFSLAVLFGGCSMDDRPSTPIPSDQSSPVSKAPGLVPPCSADDALRMDVILFPALAPQIERHKAKDVSKEELYRLDSMFDHMFAARNYLSLGQIDKACEHYRAVAKMYNISVE
jgi:hypothetical protein